MAVALNSRFTGPAHRASTQQGVSLIEVLIALVIFALGVVGMAGLQLRTMSLTMDSTQRTYVVSKSQDVADRIRGNGVPAKPYLGTYSAAADFCATPVTPVCEATEGNDVVAPCTGAQMVAYDLFDAFCSSDGGYEQLLADGSTEQRVAEWQVVISCEYPLAGVMTPTTECDEVGATVTIDTSWFGRSVANEVTAADSQRDSMRLRFVP